MQCKILLLLKLNVDHAYRQILPLAIKKRVPLERNNHLLAWDATGSLLVDIIALPLQISWKGMLAKIGQAWIAILPLANSFLQYKKN